MTHPALNRNRNRIGAAALPLILVSFVFVLAACGDNSATDDDSDGSVSQCTSIQTECGGTCVDIELDREHCGACGTTCASGEVCSEGACALECGGGSTMCDESCVDTEVNPVHCGACDSPCEDQEACTSGVCETVVLPNVPSDLAAQAIGVGQVDLTWTDTASNEAGFRIERSTAGLNSFAEVGTANADATTFSDNAAPGGEQEYRVIATNVFGDSPPSNVVSVNVEYPVQTGQISVDLTTLAVTVIQQPTDITLAPNGIASWAGAGNPLSISLDLTNDYDRILFNVKTVVTNISDNAATASGDGTYDGNPYFYYGGEAIDVAGTRNADIVVNGAGADDPLVLDVTIENHAMLFGTSDYYGGNLYANDSAGTGESTYLDIDQFTWSGGYTAPMSGVVSPDGRHVYYGLRNQPTIITVDTLTMTVTGGFDLTGQNNVSYGDGAGSMGMTRAVTMSPDGEYLYVLFMRETHNYECSTSSFDGDGVASVEVVRINRATMLEAGRVVLLADLDETQGRQVMLSEDGTRAAIAIRVYSSTYGNPNHHGRFFVIDTTTMSIIDGDPSPGDQQAPFDLSAVGARVDMATMSPDGTTVYAAISDASDDFLRVVDVATAQVTTIQPPTLTDSYTKELEFGPDGRLYWVKRNGLAIYNPGADTWVEPADQQLARDGIAFAGNGRSYYLFGNSQVVHFDISDDSVINAEADGSTFIVNSPADEGHAFVVTPF